MPRRKHTEVLTATLELAGRDLADVGCGRGDLTHYAARKGAKAIGLDCALPALEQAKAQAGDSNARFVAGVGEALPLADGSMDIVMFFNSLHHVPESGMATALTEARRVLRPGGRLYVAEPLAEGPHFSLVRSIDDETLVRKAAYEALLALRSQPSWRDDTENFYTASIAYESFDAFFTKMLSIDESREAPSAALQEALAQRFAQLGKHGDKGWLFDQPMRINVFTSTN